MAEPIKKFIIRDKHGAPKKQGSFSVVGEVHVDIVPGYGEPYAESIYEDGVLTITIHNIEGNGITDITTDSQEGDEAVNTVTIKTGANPEGVVLEVRNGSKGNTGSVGPRGPQGDSAVYDPSSPDVPDFVMANTTGQSTTKAMTQKAVTDELTNTEEISLGSIYTNSFCIISNTWYKSTSTAAYKTNGKHISVAPGEKYLIKAASDIKSVIWLISEYNPVENASVTGDVVLVQANTSDIITIPSGVFHMYIQDNTTNNVPSQKYPAKVVKIVSNLLGSTGWVTEEGTREAFVKHDVLAEYGYADCPSKRVMKIDSTDTATDTAYYVSPYIAIPSGATHIFYDNLNITYNDLYTGICVTDANHVVLWLHQTATGDTTASGVVDLSKYPTAAYLRFMPALNGITAKVRIEKIDYNDIVAGDIVNGADNIKKYGCVESSSIYSASQNVQYLTSDTPCLEGGCLGTIFGYFHGTGNCEINIGFKDQSDYLIIRESFIISVANGRNAIDVSARKIKINEGEYLFVNYHKTGNCTPYFGVDSSKTPQALYINPSSQVLEQDSGVYQSLAWSVITHTDSVSELEESVNEITEVVERNTNDIEVLKNNRAYYISDEVTGDNYQIIVRNGVLSLRSTTFHKALFLGNSLTMPQLIQDWQSSWGMAATKQEYDYTHIVQEGLRTKDANAVCTPLSFSAWERDFSTSIATLIGDNLTSDTDLVVIRLGENVPNANVSGFQTALGNLIDYIYSISPNAKVVITGVFWASSSKENAIIAAAQAKGIDYIKISQFGIAAYEEEVGHYVYGNDDGIHEITNSGVALHPSNKGMLALANTILNAIGYESVQKSYSLREVTVDGVTGTMYVED